MPIEKNIGATTGGAALLFVIIHLFLPSSGEHSAGAPPAHKEVAAEASANHSSEASAKPVLTEGPWLASRQYFHQGAPVDPGSCVDYLLPVFDKSGAEICKPFLRALFGPSRDFNFQNISSLIATIPDPLHTRVSLETDRYLDAIQQAAFRSGWELATQWLPWTAKASQASGKDASDSRSATSFDLEKLPGLIVFRRHFTSPANENNLLFVFIVGETTTAGINGFQFEAAVRCIEALDSAGEHAHLKILGPYFSGSVLSLTKLIRADGGSHDYDIRSGEISNSVYVEAMLNALRPSRVVTFHAYSVPSVAVDQQFRRLARMQDFSLDQIAELVEDESGFSQGITDRAAKGEQPITTYRYPRDISQLRNAYSDVAFSTQQKQEAAASQPLEFSLKDTQSGENAFPTFSTTHTPVSQNVILEQIIHDLNRRKVRLLSLSATNIFDTLFLAKVLAKECPNTRIVLSGADLLFVQEAAQGSLAGTLAISTYPMFPDGAAVANPNEHDITTFADADSVGVYNAALDLLGDRTHRQPLELSNNEGFSAWLLVLGRNGWLPVDLLDQKNPPLATDSWFDKRFAPSRPAAPLLPLPKMSAIWIILCLLTASLSLGVCVRLAYLAFNPCLPVWSAFCLSDLRGPNSLTGLGHARCLCLLGCLSSLIFINGLLLIPMEAARLASDSQAGHVLLGFFLFVAFLAPFDIALILLIWIAMRSPNERPAIAKDLKRSYRSILFFLRLLLVLAPFIPLFFWLRLCFAPGARGPLFSFRVLGLSAPVSSIWPMLLAGFAFLTVFFFHLRRFTWADRENPGLEIKLLDKSLGGQLSYAQRCLNAVFAGPANSALKSRFTVVALFLSVVFFLLFMSSRINLGSFEHPAFAHLFLVLLFPLAILTTGSLCQFAFGWPILRDFLANLNGIAIGRFFSRLPDFDGGGPIWVRAVKLNSLATSANSAIALHNLEIAGSPLELDAKDYWNALMAFRAPASGRDRRQILTDYRAFRRKAIELTGMLTSTILMPYWGKKRIPFIQTITAKDNESVEEKESAEEPPTQPNPPPPAPQAAILTPALAPLSIAFATNSGTASAQSATVAVMTAPLTVPRSPEPDTPPAQPNVTPAITKEAYELASKYVTLQYAVFIGYVLRHLQNLLLCCVLSFVLLAVALNSFSFQSPQTISRFLIVTLAAGAIPVIRILAQIDRNPILSRLSGTAEGQLGKDFYMRVLTYGALPVLTVLSTQFPALARFITAWAQPAMEALR